MFIVALLGFVFVAALLGFARLCCVPALVSRCFAWLCIPLPRVLLSCNVPWCAVSFVFLSFHRSILLCSLTRAPATPTLKYFSLDGTGVGAGFHSGAALSTLVTPGIEL